VRRGRGWDGERRGKGGEGREKGDGRTNTKPAATGLCLYSTVLTLGLFCRCWLHGHRPLLDPCDICCSSSCLAVLSCIILGVCESALLFSFSVSFCLVFTIPRYSFIAFICLQSFTAFVVISLLSFCATPTFILSDFIVAFV